MTSDTTGRIVGADSFLARPDLGYFAFPSFVHGVRHDSSITVTRVLIVKCLVKLNRRTKVEVSPSDC